MAATLRVRVTPRASANEIAGWTGGALRIRLTAPPVDGAANAALIDFLAAKLGVKRAEVTVASGGHSREKVLRFNTLSPDELNDRLKTVAPQTPSDLT